MQKILFFSHCPTQTGIDGANNILLRLVTALPADRYDILVAVPDEGLLFRGLKSKNINVVKLDYDCYTFNNIIFGSMNKSDIDGICQTMEDTLRREAAYQIVMSWKPDIVFTNTTMAVYGAVLGKLAGAKVIWYIHDIARQFLGPEDNDNLNTILYRYSDKIIVVGKAVKNSIGIAGSSPKCELNYIGVPLPGWSEKEVFQKGLAIRNKLSLKANCPVIGYLGRISPEKGLENIAKVAVMLQRHIPEAKFILAGNVAPTNTGYYYWLKDLINKLSLTDSIQFAGYFDNIDDILPAINCLVIPSCYEEPMPAVGIEANLYYKPVVAFNVGGIGESVLHLRNGLLVNRNDIRDMYLSIQRLLKSKKVARDMGHLGYRRAVNKFGYLRFKNSMTEIIDEVANGQFIGKPYRDCDVVTDSNGILYLIKDSARQIVEGPQLLSMGLDPAVDVKSVEDWILDTIPTY